jgi:hypothetical protein
MPIGTQVALDGKQGAGYYFLTIQTTLSLKTL